MNKALDLTIYPLEQCSIWPECSIQFHEVGNYGPNKRLSDAEVAAEYWQYSQHLLHGQVTSGKKPRPIFLKRVATLKRFATLPHYDEAT